jgi:hypothetical protein
MGNLTNLWNTILTQRTWSWALIGIGYLLVFLLVRSFFLHPLVRQARALNSKWYHEIKKVYMKKCIAGWILFLVSFLILILFWQTANLKQASLYEVGMVFLIILSVLFAIMSHLIAFGTSVIHVLKQIENNQMTL